MFSENAQNPLYGGYMWTTASKPFNIVMILLGEMFILTGHPLRIPASDNLIQIHC